MVGTEQQPACSSTLSLSGPWPLWEIQYYHWPADHVVEWHGLVSVDALSPSDEQVAQWDFLPFKPHNISDEWSLTRSDAWSCLYLCNTCRISCFPCLMLFQQWRSGNGVLSVYVLSEHVCISVLVCSMWMCLPVALVWPAACVPVQLRPCLYLHMTTHLNKLELGMGWALLMPCTCHTLLQPEYCMSTQDSLRAQSEA